MTRQLICRGCLVSRVKVNGETVPEGIICQDCDEELEPIERVLAELQENDRLN